MIWAKSLDLRWVLWGGVLLAGGVVGDVELAVLREVVVDENDLVGEGFVAPFAVGLIDGEVAADAMLDDLDSNGFRSGFVLQGKAFALSKESVLDLGKPGLPVDALCLAQVHVKAAALAGCCGVTIRALVGFAVFAGSC